MYMQFRKLGYAALAVLAVGCGYSQQRVQPSPVPYTRTPQQETREWVGFGVNCGHISPEFRTAYIDQRVKELAAQEKSRAPAIESVEYELDGVGIVIVRINFKSPQPRAIADQYILDLRQRRQPDFCPR